MPILFLIALIALSPPPSAPALDVTVIPQVVPGITRIELAASGAGQLGILLMRDDMLLDQTRGGGTAGTVCKRLWFVPGETTEYAWVACGFDLDMAPTGRLWLDVPADIAEVDVWLQTNAGDRWRETWLLPSGARLAPQVYAPLAGASEALPKRAGPAAPDAWTILDLCGTIPDNGAPWYMEDGVGNPRPCPGDAPPTPEPTPEPAPPPLPEPAYPPRVVLSPVWR